MIAELELVGREAPVAVLQAALARMLDGHGGLVSICGEPGIGKSALAARAARDAAALGARVVSGRAWELAEAPPYFPLWSGLRELGIRDRGAGEADAFQLWEQVLAALGTAAATQPFVWLLEDLHAADLLSLDLLTFLAVPLRALKVLVVVTARPRDPRLGERASQRLTRMRRDGHAIELEPLSAAQVEALATRVAERALPRAALAQLTELTGGNPLFVVECARAFRATGSTPGTRLGLPQTVREVILERVALLPERTRRALGAAAILGRDSSAATLARVQEALPAQVIDCLLPALEAGILREPRPGHFSFQHILMRDAIEAALPPLERVELHGRAEAALAALPETAEVLVERARHALAALHPDGSGLLLGQRAAQLLEELGAFDRAYVMRERIAEARARGLGGATSPDELLHLARLGQAAGRYAEARQLCTDVIAHARAAHDGELLGRAALVLGSELRPGTVDQALVEALERAHRELGPTPSALSCRVQARLAAALQPAPDPRVPITMAMQAILDARSVGDDSVLIEVLHVAGSALVDYAPEELRRTQEELLSRALAQDDTPRALSALARLAMDQAEHGEFAAWERSVDRALDLAARGVHPRQRWRALLLGSMRAVTRGDVAESERLLLEARQFAAVTDDPALALSLSAHLGQRARVLHRDDELHTLLSLDRQMDAIPHGHVVARLIRAAVYTRLEDPAAVRRELALLGRFNWDEVGAWRAWLGEALAFVGDREACRALRTELEARTRPQVVGGHVPFSYEGPLARVLGLLDAALGDVGSAERRLRAALAAAEVHGHRTWVAQLHYDLARVFAGADQPEAARALFLEAAEFAEAIGMPGLVERARRHAEHERGSSPSAVTGLPGKAPAPLLLEREGDVWRVEYGERRVRVKHSRGLTLLARLVERPGEELHVLVLASDEAGQSLLDPRSLALDAPDERARRQYKQRLDDLTAELAEAEAAGDRARAERAERERTELGKELARAFGLGGVARGSSSASERARVNVQRRIKDAIARISECDAVIGRHLERAVITGTYCRFLG